MERTQKIVEQIEAYIEGTMAGSELEDFQNVLKADEGLQNEVRKHREIKLALEDKEAINFRKKLFKISNEIKEETQETTSIRTLFLSYYKVAATIAIVIGISTFLWFSANQEKDLYLAYYTPYPIEDITRGSNTVEDEDLKLIVQKYKSRDFDSVIPDLEKRLQNTPDDERLRLYLGNSYLNIEQLNKAIQEFETISIESKYYEERLWYTMLTHVKLNQDSEAKSLLKELISYNGIHKKDAIKLLKEIE